MVGVFQSEIVSLRQVEMDADQVKQHFARRALLWKRKRAGEEVQLITFIFSKTADTEKEWLIMGEGKWYQFLKITFNKQLTFDPAVSSKLQVRL